MDGDYNQNVETEEYKEQVLDDKDLLGEKNLYATLNSVSNQHYTASPPTNVFPSFNTKTAVGYKPPKGYDVGDVYLKLGLANEGVKLEEKVNKTTSHEKRIALLNKALYERDLTKNALENVLQKVEKLYVGVSYDNQLREAENTYDNAEKDVNEISNDVNNLSNALNGITPANNSSIKSSYQQELQEELDVTTSALKNRKKQLFDAHTTRVVLSRYISRMQKEIKLSNWRKSREIDVEPFKILKNSDQFV